jgi:hypothetical protein
MFGSFLSPTRPLVARRRMFNIVMDPVIVNIMLTTFFVLDMMAIVVVVVIAVIKVIAVTAAVRHSRPAAANAALVAVTGGRRLSAPGPRWVTQISHFV